MNLVERIEQLEEQIRKLSREKNLETPLPARHGERWDTSDERQLFYYLGEFVGKSARALFRTRQGVRIKLLRLIKREYPEDWTIAHRS